MDTVIAVCLSVLFVLGTFAAGTVATGTVATVILLLSAGAALAALARWMHRRNALRSID